MVQKTRDLEISDREISITAVRRPDSIRDIDLTLRSSKGSYSFHVFYHEMEKQDGFEHMVRFFNYNAGSRYDITIYLTPNISEAIGAHARDVYWAARLLHSLDEDLNEIVPPIKFSFIRESLVPAAPDDHIGGILLYAYHQKDRYNGHSVRIEINRAESARVQTLDSLLR